MQTAKHISYAENYPLIASDRVEGTAVYNDHGEHVGRIERVMIDKRSGRVAYAIMSFGGFLGLGSEHYPVPWTKLNYKTSLSGYQLDVTEKELKNSPLKLDNDEDMPKMEEERAMFTYYGAPFYGS
ncbi:MAG: PRC-barrel domain-containing protein [Pseudomonadota bacterium]